MLLKARALLRLDRAADADALLRDASAFPCGPEESLTLRMLRGAAAVRCGDLDAGLTALRSAQGESASAHPTIQSEIALNVALAHFGRGELNAAERELRAVDRGSDIVFARSLEYHGWIALARTDVKRATAMFTDALSALDRCLHYDRFLEANCIRALAHLAVERLDVRTWSLVDERRARVDWSASGLIQPKFWIAYCAAAQAVELQDHAILAAREARAAQRAAPAPAFGVLALCKRAAIGRYTGETLSHRDHVEAAAELFEDAVRGDLTGDEILVPLVLGEELVYAGAPERARLLLDVYFADAKKTAVLCVSHTPATLGYQKFVEGIVLESSGDPRTALERFREAFAAFERIGYTRRALIAALHIVRLTRDPALVHYLRRTTSHLPPRSWLRREAERASAQRIKLTAVQREVIALICQGKSNPEIARLRKRSLHTVRNLVARLFELFEVQSREQLAVECVRRGLYSPS